MSFWAQLSTILGGTAALSGVVRYLAKKYGDKIIEAIPGTVERWREQRLTDVANFYRVEMARHSHTFVATRPINTMGLRGRIDVVENLSQWMRGPQPFLILFGQRGIGKSRCCIEFAKKENNSHRTHLMARDVVRWINIREYKNENSEKFCAALKPLIKKGTVYLYDDYGDCKNFLGGVATIVSQCGGKLLVLSRDNLSPGRTLTSIQPPVEIRTETMDQDDLRAVITARASQAGCEIDDVTMDKICRIAFGLPEVAVLCVDRVAKRGRLEGIDTLDELYYSIIFDLESQLDSDWSKIEPLWKKMVLLRGIPKEAVHEYATKIASALSVGQLVLETGRLRIKPDTLNDWIANKTFFGNGDANLDFDLIIDEATDTNLAGILTTLINLNRRSEAAKLLRRAAGQPPKVMVELGVLACEGFKEIGFVEESLGRFWEHAGEIDDADLRNRVALVLSTLGKWKEAHTCWAKAAESYQRVDNFWGVAQTQASTAAMYLRLNNWDLANKFYRLALEAAAKVHGELAQWGAARLHNSLGIMYTTKGEWAKAFEEQQLARRMYEQLPNERGMQGIGETEIILGTYYEYVGDLKQAQSSYERAQQMMVKSHDWSGLARAYSRLSLICAAQGNLKTAQELDAKALKMLAELGDSRTIAEVYKNFADLDERKGDYAEAIRCYTLARQTLEHIGDAVGMAEVDMLAGRVYERQGDRVRAVEQFQKSANTFALLGDVRNRAYCELNLGAIYYNRGDWEAARLKYEAAGVEFDRIQDNRGTALVAVNLGVLCQQNGLWQDAANHYDKALDVFNRVQDRLSAASTLRSIASLRQAGYGDSTAALEFYNNALEITQEMGAFRESLEAYTGIAWVYLSQDRAEDALQLYTRALEGFQTLGCRHEEARTQLRISSIRLKQEQLESAVDRRRIALEIGKELGNVDLIAEASSALAWLHERQAEWATATRLLEDALDIFRKIGAPLAAAEASRDIAWIHLRKGDLDAAEKCCMEAKEIFAAIQYRPGLASVYERLANVRAEKGDFEGAFDFFELAGKLLTDLNDIPSLAMFYNNKALAKHLAGQLEEAIHLCGQSLTLARKLNDKSTESYSETILGMCHRDKHLWDAAEEHFERGMQIKRSLHDVYGLAYSSAQVGIMDRERGRLEQAETGFTQAFKSFSLLGADGDARRVVREITVLTHMLRARGDIGRAETIEKVLVSAPSYKEGAN